MTRRDRNYAMLLEAAIYLKEYSKALDALGSLPDKATRITRLAQDLKEIARTDKMHADPTPPSQT